MKNKKILSLTFVFLLTLGTTVYSSAKPALSAGPMISLFVNRIYVKTLIAIGIKSIAEFYSESVNNAWELPEEYQIEKFEIDGIPMELTYKKGEKPEKVILQLHGGAYLMPFSDTYRKTAVNYVNVSGAAVLSVDYRVAQVCPYPAALEDALLGYNWLLEQGYDSSDIIIVGDSAGGGLTLAISMYLRDNQMPMPSALILMAPWVDLAATESLAKPYVGDSDIYDPYISPTYGTFDNLPKMLLQVGDDDLLLESNVKLHDDIKASGIDVILTVYEKMGHVFQLDFPKTQESIDSWQEIEEFIKLIF